MTLGQRNINNNHTPIHNYSNDKRKINIKSPPRTKKQSYDFRKFTMISPIKLNHGNRMAPIRDIHRFETFHAITSPKKSFELNQNKTLDSSNDTSNHIPRPSHTSNVSARDLSIRSIQSASSDRIFGSIHHIEGRSIEFLNYNPNNGTTSNPNNGMTSSSTRTNNLLGTTGSNINNIAMTISSVSSSMTTQNQQQQQSQLTNNNDDEANQIDENNTMANYLNMTRQTRRKLFSAVLKNELLDAKIDSIDEIDDTQPLLPMIQSASKTSLLKFAIESPKKSDADRLRVKTHQQNVSNRSNVLLGSPQKLPRIIQQYPYKILDAPDLQDDFYLNLLDWSNNNLLSVGLGSSIYLWNAQSSQVTCLGDISSFGDVVTSVKWCPDTSNLLAVGSKRGTIYLYDVEKSKSIKFIKLHAERIGVISWKDKWQITSGSRDRTIAIKDVRTGQTGQPQVRLSYHTQEVCGLDWSTGSPSISTDHNSYLASGGNDNQLCVWAGSMMQSSSQSNNTTRNGMKPLFTFTEHQAAIKAIGWSKTRDNILASGGGTVDRYLRIWDIATGTQECAIDTGSQVCSLLWSNHTDELVTAHGYSKNHIAVWQQYPSLTQIGTLTGHTSRVLFLAGSPCGKNIVSGAGDETLRFWSVFQNNKKQTNWQSSYGMEMFK